MEPRVHAFSQPAVSAAVAVAVTEVKGPDGLTTPELHALLLEYQQQTQAFIQDQASQIASLLQQVAGKASADSLSTLRQRVTTAEATLDTKAATAFVQQQVQMIGDLDAGQAAAISAAQQMLTTDGGILQNLLAKVANYDLLLPALRADVDAKAAAATVSSLTGQVTTLRNTVNDTATGLTATNTLAAAANTLAATANTEVAKRVMRTGDQMSGQLRALAPTTNDAPLLRGQVVNGLERQARDFFNVQATALRATMPSMNGAPVDDQVVDSLGANRVYQITSIQLKTLVSPTLATTITLTTTDGRTPYSRVIALTAIPAVGNTLNVLGLSGQSLPTDVVLPATFLVASSQGKFEVTIDGRLKPATPA